MASPAAYSRPRRLFSAFSSTTPRAQVPKSAPEPAPTPAPGKNAADGEADAKLHAGRDRRMRIGKILRMISDERHPDKLVSQFITASTASPRFRDNRRVYEVAVSRLASYGRRDAVAALLDSQNPFIEASRSGFAARLVRLYGRASMPSHAAATFLDLPPKHKSVTAFNALLAAYIDSGDFDKLVAAFPHTHHRRCCAGTGLSAALDVIPLMEKCGLTPDEISFNSLLNGFYNNGRFNDAEKVWQMMKERNVEPNTNSYNAKLRGLVAEGRIEDAVAVIEMMQKDGPKPDSVSYNELIRGYCKEGRLDEAKKVYDDLGVVTALVAASRIEEATRIVKLGWKNSYPPRGLKMPALTEKKQRCRS
ncbi:pentatricopeptide repeat-containing protein [Panicum miliaceum]|uniref:Pentatricopeptide repeat-containing protein n=1 Tax=Panicum miliaceum TaxID=4540 RepID=A0A3L6R1B5_PANMI|nr:pentatricopeptide repeat-containing protein [Panicum miliaceum]